MLAPGLTNSRKIYCEAEAPGPLSVDCRCHLCEFRKWPESSEARTFVLNYKAETTVELTNQGSMADPMSALTRR